MSDVSVSLDNVVKRHAATLAVDHLSLEIRRGEFFSILGPSGSGKTTTLRLIAGLELPEQGEIAIEGRSMHGVAPNRRPVNMVFQNYALFPHMTVFQNMAFGLEMQGLSSADVRRRVEEVQDMVRLQGKQDRLPSELSGGEQQRVALARALVNRPAVLLLDETLGALDQQLRQDMQVELKMIQEQVGITFVCVTHHQEEALSMSDRVAVMNHGRIDQVGSPQEIYESPLSMFVAGFIGLSNSLTGRITSVNGSICTMEASGLGPIQARQPAETRQAGTATLMIRPERLHLTQTGQSNGFDNSLPARIRKATYNGDEMQYQLELSPEIVWTARTTISSRDVQLFRSGEQIFVQWNAHEGLVLTE